MLHATCNNEKLGQAWELGYTLGTNKLHFAVMQYLQPAHILKGVVQLKDQSILVVLKTTSNKTEVRKGGGRPPFHPLTKTLVMYVYMFVGGICVHVCRWYKN